MGQDGEGQISGAAVADSKLQLKNETIGMSVEDWEPSTGAAPQEAGTYDKLMPMFVDIGEPFLPKLMHTSVQERGDHLVPMFVVSNGSSCETVLPELKPQPSKLITTEFMPMLDELSMHRWNRTKWRQVREKESMHPSGAKDQPLATHKEAWNALAWQDFCKEPCSRFLPDAAAGVEEVYFAEALYLDAEAFVPGSLRCPYEPPDCLALLREGAQHTCEHLGPVDAAEERRERKARRNRERRLRQRAGRTGTCLNEHRNKLATLHPVGLVEPGRSSDMLQRLSHGNC